jgi:Skp family chaperone for outer membrane proteins
VKKSICLMGGLVAVGVMCYVGHLWGQQAAPAAAAPRTRVALINLTYVIKNYEKYKNFQNEIKDAFKPFQGRDTDLKNQGQALAKEMSDPKTSPSRREEIELKLKQLQREVEDNNATAKLQLGKKSDEQMKILYMDVFDAAQRYAASHEFDLVLHYNDATTREEYFSPQNIARKLQSGALMPLYAAPGMDISTDVVNSLNYNLRPAGGAVPAGGSAPAGQQ